MIIGFVRHGKTDWNEEGRIQGQTDIPLNNEGIRQANALALRLSSEDRLWDAVISSDLRRAYVTAEIIATALHIPLLSSDKRLRERYFGEVEGTKEEERLARFGSDWRNSAPGVEPDADMIERGLEVMDEWRIHSPNQNLLVVSHGSFIAEMLANLCKGLGDQRLTNVSYTILEHKDGNWQPLLYNCTRHLTE